MAWGKQEVNKKVESSIATSQSAHYLAEGELYCLVMARQALAELNRLDNKADLKTVALNIGLTADNSDSPHRKDIQSLAGYTLKQVADKEPAAQAAETMARATELMTSAGSTFEIYEQQRAAEIMQYKQARRGSASLTQLFSSRPLPHPVNSGTDPRP